jgi:hypothetical protein
MGKYQSNYRPLLYALTAAGTVVLLYFFNLNLLPLQSQQQYEYEVWLHSIEKQFKRASESKPSIRIRLSSLTPDLKLAWELGSTGEEKDSDNVLGILQLIRATDLFDRTFDYKQQEDKKLLKLSIENGSRHFEAQIAGNQLKSDIQIKNLVKLFQIYAANKDQKL